MAKDSRFAGFKASTVRTLFSQTVVHYDNEEKMIKANFDFKEILLNSVFAGLFFGIAVAFAFVWVFGSLELSKIDFEFVFLIASRLAIVFGSFVFAFSAFAINRCKINIDKLGLSEIDVLILKPATYNGNGGVLLVATGLVYFKPHGLNFSNKHHAIDTAEIKDVSLFRKFGIIPNGLKITLLDDKKYKYVVNGRKRIQWIIQSEIH